MTEDRGARLRVARVRWHQSNPLLRTGIQVGAAALLAVGGFALLMARDDVNETAASVIVAVVFGVATVLQLRQSQRRQHTVELITNFQSTETLAAADGWMADRIASGRPVGADATGIEFHHAMTILDYYEFLSALGARGIIDSRLLLRLRGGTMRRCFDVCGEYIEHRRSKVGTELYRNFELLADEYARRRPKTLPAEDEHVPEPRSASEAARPDEPSRSGRAAPER